MKQDLVTAIETTLKHSTQHYKDIEEFAEQALIDYILAISKKSIILDYTRIKETKEELLMEIKEITKKKMYGFYDINEYRDYLIKNNA